jgi:hypothetical protein
MGFESITYIHGFIYFTLKADLHSRITNINQSLRENEKVKEGALPHLSDHLFVMNERIEQLLFICLV